MNRTPVLLALSAALAVAPVALAGGGHGAPDAPKPDPKPAYGKDGTGHKGPKGTMHLAQACVVENAAADGVEVKILSVNAHMRRALAGADSFTAKIGDDTIIRLVGRARHVANEDGSKTLLPKFGDHSVLEAGDRVIVRIRDARGTAAADLKAAYKIVDHGPSKRCEVPAPDPQPEPQPEPEPETEL